MKNRKAITHGALLGLVLATSLTFLADAAEAG